MLTLQYINNEMTNGWDTFTYISFGFSLISAIFNCLGIVDNLYKNKIMPIFNFYKEAY